MEKIVNQEWRKEALRAAIRQLVTEKQLAGFMEEVVVRDKSFRFAVIPLNAGMWLIRHEVLTGDSQIS